MPAGLATTSRLWTTANEPSPAVQYLTPWNFWTWTAPALALAISATTFCTAAPSATTTMPSGSRWSSEPTPPNARVSNAVAGSIPDALSWASPGAFDDMNRFIAFLNRPEPRAPAMSTTMMIDASSGMYLTRSVPLPARAADGTATAAVAATVAARARRDASDMVPPR